MDRHTLQVDLPVVSGGSDSGPGAHDLFDASLAACKALTAMRYAKTKGFSLERVEVSVGRDASRESEGHYGLHVKIAYEGALSGSEKQRIHEVVSRCPVHKLMTTSEVNIITEPLVDVSRAT